MKHNFLLIIGLIIILFPISLKSQEAPKISGYVQGLFQANLDENGKLKEGDLVNTLRIRRVRLSLDGKLTKSLSYKIQGDLINSPILVDAYLKYKPCNEFSIQAGQFKLPFTIENPINPLNLEIFDYGESLSQLAGYRDVCGVGKLGRDIGIMASGDLFKVKGKDFSIVNYNIGVFNGNGANIIDNNNSKDVVGQLNIHPMLKDLTLSGSFYYGNYYKDTINNGTRNRWTAGIQYNDGNFVVRAEYLSGMTGRQVTNESGQVLEEELKNSKGYYAVAGYNFKFGKDDSQKLMPVFRYEHFEPGDFNNAINESTNYYTIGIDYWPVKSLNFKLDYSLVQAIKDTQTNSHRIVGILSYKF